MKFQEKDIDLNNILGGSNPPNDRWAGHCILFTRNKQEYS